MTVSVRRRQPFRRGISAAIVLSLSACGGSSGSSSTTTVSSDDGLAAASLSVAASDVLGRVEVINLSTEDAVGVEL